jgi:hypothetical protein
MLASRLDKIRASQGEKQFIRYVKTLRVHIYKHLAGEPLSVSFLKIDKARGLPSIFGTEINTQLLVRDRDTYRMVLTILQISYLIRVPLNPKTSTIDEPTKCTENIIQDLRAWSAKFTYSIVDPSESLPEWTSPHRSTSAGPIGPAVWSAPDELSLLPETLIENLKVLGGPQFSQWLEECKQCKEILIGLKDEVSLRSKLASKKPTLKSIRKLTTIASPEGKTRVIAILDYWSQTVLKVMHDWSFDLLRKIPSDMTYNQNGCTDVLRGCSSYHSFDLSAATDRFPISLQEIFLSDLIGPERAGAWRNILVDIPFTTTWDCSTHKYYAGQPMGAYSSWSIFSLSHHLIVRYSAYLAGLDPVKFHRYTILGDDLVIADTAVASQYLAVISALGVDISLEKSLVSNDTYEFAKRIFHKDDEYTAFPLASFADNFKSISALWSSTLVARERGFNYLDFYSIPGLLARIQITLGYPKRNTTRMTKDMEALYQLSIADDRPSDLTPYTIWVAKSMGLRSRCNESLSNCLKRIDHLIGRKIVDYKTDLLFASIHRGEELMEIMCSSTVESIIASMPPGQTDTDDQSALPIDPSRVPIIWVLQKDTEALVISVTEARFKARDGGFKSLRTINLTPAGDLTRIISRQVNVKAASRNLGFISFLRAEITNMERDIDNALTEDELTQSKVELAFLRAT